VSDWRVLGASAVGSLHLKGDRGCDDAHGWSVRKAMSILVIADGAGSRPGTSAIGAHVAVAAVLGASRDRRFATAVAENASAATCVLVERAIAALTAEARILELEPGALATTLCVAVLVGDHVVVAQIGDGIAVVEHESGTIETVAVAERFEYANEVVFATAPDALDHLKVYAADDDPVRSVALCTDGLRYKILDVVTSAPFEPFFRESWASARKRHPTSEAVEKFLREVDDQTGDDKTLLLAVREFAGRAGRKDHLTPRPPSIDPEPGAEQPDSPVA